MDKKYQIFVSSTFKDLHAERRETVNSILDLDEIPAGMELFPATDMEQFEYIKRVIDRCDYYVLISAGRYGSTGTDGTSYTEMEFDYAKARGIPILAFLHIDPFNKLTGEMIETDPGARARLERFREKSRTGRIIQYWSDANDLQLKVTKSISRVKIELPRTGWIRADTASSSDALATIVELRNEVKRLKELIPPQHSRVENLAAIDTHYDFKYLLTTYDPYGSPQSSPQVLRAKWSELWRMLGPKFITPNSASHIHLEVEAHYQHLALPKDIRIDLTRASTNQIKLQFIALGFLELTAGLGETLKITERGMEALLELMAVREPGEGTSS